MIFNLLKSKNLKLEDLNASEKDTLYSWANALATKQIEVKDIKDYVRQMISGVENELAILKPPRFWEVKEYLLKVQFLNARLKNYLLLTDFLTGPERAQKVIEQGLNNLKK